MHMKKTEKIWVIPFLEEDILPVYSADENMVENAWD
jgi:hypothetical protein